MFRGARRHPRADARRCRPAVARSTARPDSGPRRATPTTRQCAPRQGHAEASDGDVRYSPPLSGRIRRRPAMGLALPQRARPGVSAGFARPLPHSQTWASRHTLYLLQPPSQPGAGATIVTGYDVMLFALLVSPPMSRTSATFNAAGASRRNSSVKSDGAAFPAGMIEPGVRSEGQHRSGCPGSRVSRRCRWLRLVTAPVETAHGEEIDKRTPAMSPTTVNGKLTVKVIGVPSVGAAPTFLTVTVYLPRWLRTGSRVHGPVTLGVRSGTARSSSSSLHFGREHLRARGRRRRRGGRGGRR